MKCLVVYSSKTGNTRKVAEAIFQVMPENSEIYPVEDAPAADGYDFVAVGFWVDRGTADDKAKEYLQTIKDKRVGLFGTLGAYPDSEHAQKSMANAAALLDAGNTLAGTFICQGKVDPALVEKFKSFPEGHPHAITPEKLQRYEIAGKHPDADDLAKAQEVFRRLVNAG